MQNCKVCDASWNIAKKIDICPFCGADLREKKIMTSIEDAFQVIVDKHGKEVLKESRKFLGLLSDYAPELIKERNLVKMAVETGAYKAIYEASIVSDVAQKQAVKKYALVLHETFFIDKIWAEKVMVWCSNMISGNFKEQDCSEIKDDRSISSKKEVVKLDKKSDTLKKGINSYSKKSDSKKIENKNNRIDSEKINNLSKKTLAYGRDLLGMDLWSLYEAYDYVSRTFVIPEGIKNVTKECLSFHWNMEQLVIPASVEYIEYEALKDCKYLKNIQVNEENKYYCVIYGDLMEKKSYKVLWP